MISQNFPLYVTWWADEQATREHWVRRVPGELSARVCGAAVAGDIRYDQTGLVVGWWAVPGDLSTVLIPIVAGQDERPTAPVVDEGARFFYSATLSSVTSVAAALEAFADASIVVSGDSGVRDAIMGELAD